MWLVGNKITYVVHTCGLHSVSIGQLWPKPPLTKKPSAYEELRWQSCSGLILKRKKRSQKGFVYYSCVITYCDSLCNG